MYVWSELPTEYESTGHGCQSCSWSAEQENYFFPYPRTHLIIRSRETGLAVPSCVSPFVLHTQAESGAYSRESSHFPRRRTSQCCTAVALSLQALLYNLCLSRTSLQIWPSGLVHTGCPSTGPCFSTTGKIRTLQIVM